MKICSLFFAVSMFAAQLSLGSIPSMSSPNNNEINGTLKNLVFGYTGETDLLIQGTQADGQRCEIRIHRDRWRIKFSIDDSVEFNVDRSITLSQNLETQIKPGFIQGTQVRIYPWGRNEGQVIETMQLTYAGIATHDLMHVTALSITNEPQPHGPKTLTCNALYSHSN